MACFGEGAVLKHMELFTGSGLGVFDLGCRLALFVIGLNMAVVAQAGTAPSDCPPLPLGASTTDATNTETSREGLTATTSLNLNSLSLVKADSKSGKCVYQVGDDAPSFKFTKTKLNLLGGDAKAICSVSGTKVECKSTIQGEDEVRYSTAVVTCPSSVAYKPVGGNPSGFSAATSGNTFAFKEAEVKMVPPNSYASDVYCHYTKAKLTLLNKN